MSTYSHSLCFTQLSQATNNGQCYSPSVPRPSLSPAACLDHTHLPLPTARDGLRVPENYTVLTAATLFLMGEAKTF